MCIHSTMIPESMCSGCTRIARHTPAARPVSKRARRGIPTWTQWLRFKRAEPLPHMALCILCKEPISKLTADTIRIGCRVKVTETETYEVCNVEYKETTTKIIPVVLTGLGCPVCQYEYVKTQAAEIGRYADADAGYSRDLADPGKRGMLMRYGCTAPNKRTAVIDVSEQVLEMDRTPPVRKGIQ